MEQVEREKKTITKMEQELKSGEETQTRLGNTLAAVDV